ncbi:prenyltransferase/squalene oxidase repeat-containing protein [Methanobacterium aggregans]|uniref:prenyltransferase/squalene oxidase repeat-containing protein n=1 Tax=Methanobacterium aggregans TaxID=1615586 RepID=UPI001AE27C94|nr:prenyltransferase/squalene oxidase repeat-containing protein [Methanobacterium aggregans]MBP2046456.1 hypothetical protein [Methanobacterium aggregans]
MFSKEKALKFVYNREHPEGGFTLYEGIPDTKNTYYALKTLQIMGKKPKNLEKTLKWISYLHNGRMFGLKGFFYRLNILKLYGIKLEVPEKYKMILTMRNEFSTMEVAFLNTAVLKLMGYQNFENVKDWVLQQKKEDGGFGRTTSNIMSTYYALEILNLVDPKVMDQIFLEDFLEKLIGFTVKCQTSDGGFAYKPGTYPSYIEGVYAGIRIHELLDREPKNHERIIDFTKKLQNSDGGFRRSKYLGISELEYTFRAIYILKSLSAL